MPHLNDEKRLARTVEEKTLRRTGALASQAQIPTVLVVDDDPDICFLVEMSLTPDYNVMAGATVQEVEQALSKGRPDVVLLDLHLAGMNPIQVLEVLRDRVDVPVIVVTGVTDAEQRAKCLELGAADFLLKPFHLDELRLRIQSVIHRPAGAGSQKR